MKTRHVYLTPNLAAAERLVAELRALDVPEQDIALVARADIEMNRVSDDMRNASTDFMPAAMRGALTGGGMGMLGGLIAAAIPPLGITVAGAAIITALGAATGAWASALVGSSLPDPIRRRFEDAIAEGRILLVLDASEDAHAALHARLLAGGAEPMPFTEPTALG